MSRWIANALSLCLVLVPATAHAVDAPLADVSFIGSGVVFQPTAPDAALALTISGPDGFYWRGQSGPEESLYFPGAVEDGVERPDGVYVYELRRTLDLDEERLRALEPLRGTGRVSKALAESGLTLRSALQSGAFTIADGVVVAPETEVDSPANSLTTKATVITISDGTINDSLCVGAYCSSSPPFGDSTLLLQEVNTRIKFDDGSSASYPDRDWELTANDSFAGGLERFSISDCGAGSGASCTDREVFSVEGGVRENALYVEADGEIGIGTANPAATLHLITGDTPGLRLEQDASQGFTAQTWEVFGNEAGFIVQDVTAGSFEYPFRIEPGAGTHRLVLEADGDVGIGTLNPGSALHLTGTDGSTKLLVEEANATTTGRQVMELRNNGNVNFILVNTAAGGEDWQLLGESTGSFPGFSISRQGSGVRELYLDDSGNLEITGQITTSGSCSGGCDLVFDPDYALPSIEEHAAAMFANRHLPAVGPTPEQGRFNLSQKVGGMLNELEKAHIYIAQLDEEKRRLEQELRAEIEELRAALGALTASQD